MKFFRVYIALLLLSVANSINAQVNCVTDPPLPPVLNSVSVIPETGQTVFTWTPGPSADIAAYILYSYKNGDGIALDTIRDPAATSYTLTSTATKYFSVSYVVAAMRLPRCTSIFSNAINSIFVAAKLDTCAAQIKVNWNSYPDSPVKVSDYTVYAAVDGSSYAETGKTANGITSYTLNNYKVNSEYCFIIRANLVNGSSSSSNKTCLTARMQRPPAWINADQATVNPSQQIELTFTVDPQSEISLFSLEKRNDAGVFSEIARPAYSSGKVTHTDRQADIKKIGYYRLSAVNNCGIAVRQSNIASNIVLTAVPEGDRIKLTWNNYRQWMGTISAYRLNIDKGTGFGNMIEISPSDTSFMLDYQQIMYDVAGREICFYITASESNNPYGIDGLASSQNECTDTEEKIVVPNVFTPDNNSVNDYFRPVLTFTPLKYRLVITDRRGLVMFETDNFMEQWDGSKNGSTVPQDVYLWQLRLTTPSGRNISRSGTVTLYINR
jgi:gliding motility-associated-like protein